MPKVMIDPVKQTEQFKADLAAMAVGQKKDGAPVKQHLLDKNFNLTQFRFNRWSAELTEAQTLEDALDPTFWTGQADKVMGHDKAKPNGRGDIIEVRKLDTGLYAELLITEIGKGFVKVALLRRAEAASVDIPENSPLTTRWNVASKTHDVIRASDKQLMRGGFQTKAAAAEWIADHLAKLAA